MAQPLRAGISPAAIEMLLVPLGQASLGGRLEGWLVGTLVLLASTCTPKRLGHRSAVVQCKERRAKATHFFQCANLIAGYAKTSHDDLHGCHWTHRFPCQLWHPPPAPWNSLTARAQSRHIFRYHMAPFHLSCSSSIPLSAGVPPHLCGLQPVDGVGNGLAAVFIATQPPGHGNRPRKVEQSLKCLLRAMPGRSCKAAEDVWRRKSVTCLCSSAPQPQWSERCSMGSQHAHEMVDSPATRPPPMLNKATRHSVRTANPRRIASL